MGRDDEHSTWYRPALLNFAAGLVATFATAAVTLGLNLWADYRVLARDVGLHGDRLDALDGWRNEAAGFSAADGRRLAERVYELELAVARHDGSGAPGPGAAGARVKR